VRICRQYAPPGIRIAGEIDYKAEEPLTLALSEAVRLDGDITMNMSALAFIDAFCARMIADTVKMLADSRTVILQRKPEVAAGFARLGLDSLPGVRLVTVREQ
jgi:anti-anti-sigma regulatory factor